MKCQLKGCTNDLTAEPKEFLVVGYPGFGITEPKLACNECYNRLSWRAKVPKSLWTR